jgi:hypothetical protein
MDTMDGSQMEEEYQQQLLDEIVTNSRDLITLEDTEEEQQQQENCQHTMDADKDGLATNTTNMNTTSKERSMEECLVDVASTLIVSNNLDLEVDSVQDMENIQMELENKHRAITRIQVSLLFISKIPSPAFCSRPGGVGFPTAGTKCHSSIRNG